MPQMFPSYHSLVFILFFLIYTFFICIVYWQSFSSLMNNKVLMSCSQKKNVYPW